MGRKLEWTKNYSEGYLADVEANQLSFHEHGLLRIINDILWTQTDEIGSWVKAGRIRTASELIAAAIRYTCAGHRCNMRYVCAWYANLHAHGFLGIDADGTIYSPFIRKEVERSQLNKKHGALGGNPRLTTPDNPPLNQGGNPRTEQSRTEEEKEQNRANRTTVSPSGLFSGPKPEKLAHRAKDYQVEVLEKIGADPQNPRNPSGGTLYLIGKHVPDQIISQALAATQDAHQRGECKNPTAYYVSTVKRMCAEHGVKTPIKWKE